MKIQSGVKKPFNYVSATQDAGLFVGASLMDVSAGFPGTLVGSLIQLTETPNGIYCGSFIGEAGKQYQLRKLVYDVTFTTVDINYSPDVEDFECFNEFSDLGTLLISEQDQETLIIVEPEQETI